MNYKFPNNDSLELTYTNCHNEKMTLKLDDKGNILIKHDDISATSNFVPLNKAFFKAYVNFSNDEKTALELQVKTLQEFYRSKVKRLANNVPCSLELDYEWHNESI